MPPESGSRRSFRATAVWPTAVLSNIGGPHAAVSHFVFHEIEGSLVAGDVMLAGIEAVPPLRPLTRLVMLINTYGGTAVGQP